MGTLARQPAGRDLSDRQTKQRSRPSQPSRADLVIDRALIGGRWVSEVGGRTFAVLDPADGSHVIDVPDCGATEASAATDCRLPKRKKMKIGQSTLSAPLWMAYRANAA